MSSSPQIDGRRGLGRTGENLAAAAVCDAGMTVVDRNWRCPLGELDIVAYDSAPDFTRGGEISQWLVFVEVRTRRGTSYGSALEAVGARKQAKLREVAEMYVQSTGWTGPWRIDVVAVQMDRYGHLQSIDLVRNAVVDE